MKKLSLPSILIICALRGTLFLGAGLVLVQPCKGGPGVFENTGSLGAARRTHTATLLPNGKVLVAAGENSNGDLASAELYDPASGTWTATGSLSEARHRHAPALLTNGKVLVVGGSGDSGLLASAELYDPASGTWTATGSLATARTELRATLLPNGRVLVSGGYDGNNGGIYFANADLYDPASGTWTVTTSLATARSLHSATLLPNGKVLVVGGLGAGNAPLASAELYDPASGIWTATSSLAAARIGHSATLLPSGKVLVAGGTSDNISAIASAELYDPATGIWTATGNLGVARGAHQATLLPNGKVLVAGGRADKGDSYLTSAEVYIPASETWTATGGLAVARTDHTVTLLPNGKVLVAGGENGSGSLASAELYDQGPPLITSPLAATGTVGLPFTYQFEASGATSLAASNLAPGLSFNTSLEAITGLPTTAGTFQVGLSATNSQGTTNATLVITVQPAPASGPVIISSTAATGRTGRPFSFQLQTSGGSSATRFAVDGLLPPGLNLDPVTGFISGVPNPDGNFSLAVSAIDGATTANATLQLTFTSDPTVPIITSPNNAILMPGQFFTYTITADANGTFGYIGTDGIVHQGPSQTCAGLPAGLCFDGINTISGVFNGGPISGVETEATDRNAIAGPRRISGLAGGIVTNVLLFATDPSGTGTFPLVTFISARGTVQISTRMAVGTGDNALIGGFIISGTGTTKALIRAIGPSLSLPPFNISGTLQDPALELRDEAGSLLGSNDNWRDSQENAIIAATLPVGLLAPTNNLESAILAFLSPGSYTAIVRGNNNTTGVGLVEVYDLGIATPIPPDNARLANISTRGFVETGDNVIIGGFIILPEAPATSTRVILRAIGPSLTQFGIANALANPTLELRDANAALLDANNDWQDNPAHAVELIAANLAPTNQLESGIAATLPLGPCTAIVRGIDNTTGVALVEVYALP